MDKEQAKVAGYNGKSWRELPNTRTQPRMTFYKLEREYDEEAGEYKDVPVAMNLPAEPPYLQKYLNRGFVLDPKDLPQASKAIACEACGLTHATPIEKARCVKSKKGE